jgi:pyruvate/2-oxoglutarate dehydrogenase complex dihydrolipoamide dehydrogenase (E3) component
METELFDAIVVGAGQAGPAIAARCSREGLKTAVIERHHFGGTCVNVGCVPTKTLVASARAIRLAQRGAEFGFDVADLRVDMARVMARKDAIVAKSREGVEAWLRGLKGTEVIVGDARFVATATIEAAGRRLTAPRIFLNVGGRAARPALPGIDAVPTLDNVSVMELDEVPEHLVIVGGSYIGLEFAHLMRRLGAAVTVVERSPRLLAREDQDVSDGIRSILEAEGVRFELGAECLSLARAGKRIVVGAACGSGEGITGSHVLLAVGRQPNTDGLGLDRAASGRTRAAISKSTISAAPALTVSGLWATAMGAVLSRTRHGTTTKSSLPTCSTTIHAA